MRTRASRVIGGGLLAAFLVVGGHVTGAAAQEATGEVTLVHGLRGLLADVYVDGQAVLQGFQPERVTDPIALPAGAHQVDLRPALAPPDSPPLISAQLQVAAGASLSAVVHLAADGQQVVTVFTNDTSPVPAGSARLAFRNTAAAGPVDVAVDGTLVADDLANAQQSTPQALAAATHEVTVSGGGSGAPVVPPAPVTLADGTAHYLYLVGSAAEGSVGWLTQSVTRAGMQTPPNAVVTGNSGLAAPTPSPSVGMWAVVAGVGALSLLARPVLSASHRRTR